MSRIWISLLLLFWMIVLPVNASETLFISDQFQDDLDIRSVEAHDQSRIWSTCAAVHELVAVMDDNGADSPSAKESANQGRGAKVASAIVFIVDYFAGTDAPDPTIFASKWQTPRISAEDDDACNRDASELRLIMTSRAKDRPIVSSLV